MFPYVICPTSSICLSPSPSSKSGLEVTSRKLRMSTHDHYQLDMPPVLVPSPPLTAEDWQHQRWPFFHPKEPFLLSPTWWKPWLPELLLSITACCGDMHLSKFLVSLLSATRSQRSRGRDVLRWLVGLSPHVNLAA